MIKTVYILMGPPGAGKGTQSKLLSKKFHIEHFSMGQALRHEVARGTAVGKKVEPILAKGALVPDEVVTAIIQKKIAKMKKAIILDGFPRKVPQAKILDQILKTQKTKNIFFELHLAHEGVYERISGRLDCECGEIYHLKHRTPKVPHVCDVCGRKLIVRTDSTPQIVKNRIKSYEKDTVPVIRFIQKDRNYIFRKIDASKPIKEVYEMILKELKKINK